MSNGRHERRIEILGIPMDLGQNRRGVDMGPSSIRYARLQSALEELGHTVFDLGNISVPIPEVADPEEVRRKNMPYLGTIREVCERTTATARDIVTGDAFPVFLGGDHSVSIGTVSGMAAVERIGVLWVDAHADFNTPEISLSGNVHGMSLAALCGLVDPDLVGVGGGGASVRPEDVVLVGLRRVDPEERCLLAEAGVRAYTMKEVDEAHPPLLRPRCGRPGNRSGCRHTRQGRTHLPRGPPTNGAPGRGRSDNLSRRRRDQPYTR